ncbi:MAG: bacillithiol biosynthesis deacetylase BshB1 [Phycisphaeraceae bacterium]
MSVDVLVIAAHPDDAEMTVGGTLAKLADRGYTTAIVDMTRGEMGSRGTAEQRDEEAAAAAKVLNVSHRVNLDLGDGLLENTLKNRVAVIEQIRHFRPKLVIAAYWEDLHPDHRATGYIVRDIMYPCGFAKFPAKGEPHRPKEFLFFMQHWGFEPSFIVDITGYHEQKLDSVRCYDSQLYQPGENDKLVWISDPNFLARLEARARTYGTQIRTEFGEPLLSCRPVPIDDPMATYKPFFD